MTHTLAISVILPCYRQAEECLTTVWNVAAACGHSLGAVEILVVSDGPEKEQAFLRSHLAAHPQVRLLCHPRRLGKGGAVRRGVLAARGRIVAFLDADGAIAPSFLARFVRAVLDNPSLDILTAKRTRYTASAPRKIMSAAYRLLIRILFALPVTDTQAGLKVFRGEAARTLFSHLRTHGYAFDIEILCRARKQGMTIRERAVTQRKGGRTTLTARAVLRMLRDTFVLFFGGR
jgi:dolichyl-phosphate beta-glucosyltransferase